MAEMAIGYGSEFQLLRFLGHHRIYLNRVISSELKTKENIFWLDYPIDVKRHSLDGELKDIQCFKNERNFEKIIENWKNYWPQGGNSQNWDGIFKIDESWYFVEAKAHRSEVESSCGATSEKSKDIIKKTFEETIQVFNSSKTAEYWVSKDCKSYQLANRLAFVNFCRKNNIDARLLYINFLNGFDKPGTNGQENIKTKEEWEKIWEVEYSDLGIQKENLREILYNVYINCIKIDEKF